MFKSLVKFSFVLVLVSSSFLLYSQNVAINTSGNIPYVSAILDLSNNNIVGNVGFLPPYVTLPASGFGLAGTASQSNGLLVYNTGGSLAAGLYYWNNTTGAWVAMSGGAAAVSADNGLSYGSFTANKVELGGTTSAPSPLVGNSVISGSGFSLDYDLGTYSAAGTGSFLITNGGTTHPYFSVSYNAANTVPAQVGVNVNPAQSTLDDNGSFGYASITVSGATTLTNAYSTVYATPGSGYTITLPSATTSARRIMNIVYQGGLVNYNTSSTSDIVNIQAAGGQNIVSGNLTYASGTTSFALGSGSVTLQSDGTQWNVISNSNDMFYSYNTSTVNGNALYTAALSSWNTDVTLPLPVGNYMVTFSCEGYNNVYADWFYAFTDASNTLYAEDIMYNYGLENTSYNGTPSCTVYIVVPNAGLTLYVKGSEVASSGGSKTFIRNATIRAVKIN
jgi:hypothetical protein